MLLPGIELKTGVQLAGIRPEMVVGLLVVGLLVAAPVFTPYEVACVVTSVNDSKHGFASLHWQGAAVDLRSRHLPTTEAKKAVQVELKRRLGGDFDVLLEGLDTPNEHFHIEYQPKRS